VEVVRETCSDGSTDLTVPDFFFWGYIKNTAYAEEIRGLHHLRGRICAAIDGVTPEMLSPEWEEAEYRIDICRVTNGAHTETVQCHSRWDFLCFYGKIKHILSFFVN